MSARRRRWSSEHVNSLLSFQSKSRIEETQFVDSLEVTNNQVINTQDESSLLRSPFDTRLIDETVSQINLIQFSSNKDDLIQFRDYETKKIVPAKVNLNHKFFTQNPEKESESACISHSSSHDLINFSGSDIVNKSKEELQLNLNTKINKPKEEVDDKNVGFNSNKPLVEFTEIIADGEEPRNDIWSTLSALEEVLGSSKTTSTQPPIKGSQSRLLRRLSREFKNTPSKFTERLLSIIEESVLSTESPSKLIASTSKDINVHNMTAEFRKLCKFIEDESMPEMAITLNMTTFENTSKTGTPVVKKQHIADLITPKKDSPTNSVKSLSSNEDKSFEYWEAVCNMICDQKNDDVPVVKCPTPENVRASMNNMLTICERQMASLDDSSIEIRSSDPLKPVKHELKIIEVPRSKSACGLISRNLTPVNINFETPSNVEVQTPDDSIMLEVIKRRQRCFDTAKLMLEIDGEDSITNDDKKCLEYLYKLGIQDKTMPEIETDMQLLSTLNQCLDYKSYLMDKSKPIRDILQNRISEKIDAKDGNKKVVKKNLPSTPANTPVKSSPIRRIGNSEKMSMAKSVLTKNLYSSPSNVRKETISSRQKSILRTPILGKFSTPKETIRPANPLETKSTTKKNSNFKSSPAVRELYEKNQPIFRSSPNLQFLTPIPKLNTSNSSPKTLKARKNVSSKQSTPQNLIKFSPMARSIDSQSSNKWLTPRTLCQKIPVEKKATTPISSKNFLTPTNSNVNNSPAIKNELISSRSMTSKTKSNFFSSPGTSSVVSQGARKKPTTYFSSSNPRTPQKLNTENIKSPIGLYINGRDTNLIKNVRSKTNDLLLTPISKELESGKSPRLKFNLSSKENKSPITSQNTIELPKVHYQPSDQVLTEINKQKISTSAKMQNLLKPLQNQVIIRHEGRKVDADKITETSIRVQKTAERTVRRPF